MISVDIMYLFEILKNTSSYPLKYREFSIKMQAENLMVCFCIKKVPKILHRIFFWL